MPALTEKQNHRPAGQTESKRFGQESSLEGIVAGLVFRNDENGYTVLTLDDAEGPTVVGILPFLSPGEHVRLFGQWKDHPDYGRQFSAVHYELLPPKTSEAIEHYLASGLIKGIGEALARRLVRAFGEKTLEILRDHPDQAVQVKGISSRKAAEVAEQLKAKQEYQDLALLLSPLGIGPGMLLRIVRQYGSEAVRQVSENPYRLADEVIGIGFLTADRLAMSLGLDPTSTARITGAFCYVLVQAAADGHTYLPKALLIQRVSDLLHDELKNPDRFLDGLENQKRITRYDDPAGREDQRIALVSLFETEQGAAEQVKNLLKGRPKTWGVFQNEQSTYRIIADLSEKNGLELAPEQKRALLNATREPVMILTGGPGTGKTTLLKLLCDCFEARGGTIHLAAPTGRAARRLSETTGRPAQTLHRLLELQFTPETRDAAITFHAQSDKKLKGDLVIVDESSMIDIFLFQSLVEAIVPGTRLLLVGDADQLPSVGPGDVLHDLIKSEIIPTVRLNHIFRQSAESLIIVNAHRIHDGLWPKLNQSKDSPFLLIPKESAEAAAQAVIRLVQVILPNEYGLDSLRDVFVLTPTRKGPAGTYALNERLQEIFFPPDRKRPGIKAHGRFFGIGDKVMQTRNNYELTGLTEGAQSTRSIGVFNGETGTIVSVNVDEDTLHVLFDDERTVLYDRASLEDLDLAYAMTVHKSQGSEYPVVILAIAPGAPQLLTRNLLYTAVTRAREKLLLVASRYVIEQMLRNKKAQRRYTFLDDCLNSPLNRSD
jgi:exodeoxyribonuclease V alpha subunit